MGYGLDDRGFKSRQELGVFLFTTASRPALVPTEPPIQCVPGALYLWVKRPGREADHHLHLVPKSRMCGAINPLLQYAFMAQFKKKSTGTTFPIPSLRTIPHYSKTYKKRDIFSTSILNTAFQCKKHRNIRPIWKVQREEYIVVLPGLCAELLRISHVYLWKKTTEVR
jgi:hypothetical protein